MRHVFIINPAAGTKGGKEHLEASLHQVCAAGDAEIYYTKGVGDATKYIREVCGATDEKMRFYACGGDGTLNEVFNGAADFENAAVGCYPCGSGNDFVKCFGGVERFLDIKKLMDGKAMPIDLISVNGVYCMNVCNFGLDSAVADTMQRIKNKFIFKGKSAYFAGVVKAFVKNVRTDCSVKVDGEELSGGTILLCTIANGQYVGGSFRCAPRAMLDDGFLDVCLVKPIHRARFLTLMGPYSRGEHLDRPEFASILTYRRGKEIEVASTEADFIYALDGEIVHASSFTAKVVEGASNFIVPEGADTAFLQSLRHEYV